MMGVPQPKPVPRLLAKQKAAAKLDRAWWTLRKAVMARDGHACRACGDRHGLEAHHVVMRSLGGRDEVENLIALCRECHRAVHGHVLKLRVTYPSQPQFKLGLEWVR